MKENADWMMPLTFISAEAVLGILFGFALGTILAGVVFCVYIITGIVRESRKKESAIETIPVKDRKTRR